MVADPSHGARVRVHLPYNYLALPPPRTKTAREAHRDVCHHSRVQPRTPEQLALAACEVRGEAVWTSEESEGTGRGRFWVWGERGDEVEETASGGGSQGA
jgi:hypothetical protein